MRAPISCSADQAQAARARIASIDALRGLVILLMLVDHTREFFFGHVPVGDPMDLRTTPTALFFTRLSAHLCAPIFVALTGLAAWLYAASRGGAGAASDFLLKRGLFLVVLELTLVNFAWGFDLTPDTMFLQVIWAIGLSMMALAALVHLPRRWLIAVAAIIVLGHNLLEGITFAPNEPGYTAWAFLHDRGIIDLPWGARARTSYPLLPWIGIIALGYAIGPWFARGVHARVRRTRLLCLAAAALIAFAVLRGINGYGEPVPWQAGGSVTDTVKSFLNVTKYPPSADFALLTLGTGALLLVALEGPLARAAAVLTVFGSVPLFFYLLHLYVLHASSRGLAAMMAADGLARVPHVGWLWLIAAIVALPCWFACRRFGAMKRGSDAWWMRYL